MTGFSFEALSRRPDVEAPDLVAVDATDRLILDEAGPLIAAAPDAVVTIGDRYGALTLGAAALQGARDIRAHQDPLVGEWALARNAETTGLAGVFTNHPLDASLLADARVVLMQLPRALAELDEIAGRIAEHAHPEVVVVAGGRVKHMTPAMNDVLGQYFGEGSATRARQKSRALIARHPRQGVVPEYPKREWLDELDLWVCAHGGAFAGPRLDLGTRFLLQFLPQMRDAASAIDLGCGTGILAASLKRARPHTRVIASDQSASAVASARATAEANGLDVEAVRDVGLASQPDASADLILLNPPFHSGAVVTDRLAPRLFDDAARVLAPGGELWTVYNSHLQYRPTLERLVGPTRQAGRDPRFTVTVSTR